MASRFRSLSRPAQSLLKSAISRPSMTSSSSATPSLSSLRSSLNVSRSIPRRLGCAQSLLPLHSAVASARMISRLGPESSRSLSQGIMAGYSDG